MAFGVLLGGSVKRIYSVFSLTAFTAILFLLLLNYHNAAIGFNKKGFHEIKVENKVAVMMSMGLVGLSVVEANNYFKRHDKNLVAENGALSKSKI